MILENMIEVVPIVTGLIRLAFIIVIGLGILVIVKSRLVVRSEINKMIKLNAIVTRVETTEKEDTDGFMSTYYKPYYTYSFNNIEYRDIKSTVSSTCPRMVGEHVVIYIKEGCPDEPKEKWDILTVFTEDGIKTI